MSVYETKPEDTLPTDAEGIPIVKGYSINGLKKCIEKRSNGNGDTSEINFDYEALPILKDMELPKN